MKRVTAPLTAGTLLLAAACAHAQDKPATAPAPAAAPSATTPAAKTDDTASDNTFGDVFKGKIPDAFAKGKFSINARLRYEYADQDSIVKAANLKESDAFTLRTRFGFTTAPVYGFQGMVEGENITVLGPRSNYNAAGSNGQPGKTVIADPATTELNQAWLSYSNWDTTLKGGRERIVLDNERFIGDVGWRDNMQTFDAATFENKSIKDLDVFYGYIWDVHRVFGDVDGLPAASANRDFDSKSHIINVSYSACQYAKITGYSYLLDLKNRAGAGNSTATYGGNITGNAPITDKVSLDYRGEFAWQTEYAQNPVKYGADYYNVELGVNVKPVVVGGGYEVLGQDNGQGFKTPLATLHAFNGWADVFLNTPAKGLRDAYGFVQVTLPYEVPVRFVYHKYDSDVNSVDYGQEYDAVISKKFGKNWKALLKYAYYDGKKAAAPAFAAPIDMHKFWAQIEFNY